MPRVRLPRSLKDRANDSACPFDRREPQQVSRAGALREAAAVATMAQASTLRKPAAARAEPAKPNAAHAEHILIASDEGSDPRAAHKVLERWRLGNPLRRMATEITVFEEGYAEITHHAGRKSEAPFRLDLRYLDPIPSITRVIATRAWWTAAGCAGAALAAFMVAYFTALGAVAASFGLGAAAAAAVAVAIALQRSHETIEYVTLHGRAPVLALVANFGAIKPFRAFVPELSQAIEEAAEEIAGDTSSFLRAEMREHYRLRGDGVLSVGSCAECTGRILAHFDVQL